MTEAFVLHQLGGSTVVIYCWAVAENNHRELTHLLKVLSSNCRTMLPSLDCSVLLNLHGHGHLNKLLYWKAQGADAG